MINPLMSTVLAGAVLAAVALMTAPAKAAEVGDWAAAHAAHSAPVVRANGHHHKKYHHRYGRSAYGKTPHRKKIVKKRFVKTPYGVKRTHVVKKKPVVKHGHRHGGYGYHRHHPRKGYAYVDGHKHHKHGHKKHHAKKEKKFLKKKKAVAASVLAFGALLSAK